MDAYFQMLEQELTKQAYRKAYFRQRLEERISRTKGSIEFKFQNISAVLQHARCPFIDGYKPRFNYQISLADEVLRQLSSNEKLADLMHRSVSAPAAPRLDIAWHTALPAAPLIELLESGPKRGFHTDFVQLEQANRELGLAGELAVFERERSRLISHGRSDLADRVVHASKDIGDGLGYDIRSFTVEGRQKYIEVKTTRRGVDWPMLVSRNEVMVSADLGPAYELHRVFHFDARQVGLYTVAGDITRTCELEPASYRALPKAGMASTVSL